MRSGASVNMRGSTYRERCTRISTAICPLPRSARMAVIRSPIRWCWRRRSAGWASGTAAAGACSSWHTTRTTACLRAGCGGYRDGSATKPLPCSTAASPGGWRKAGRRSEEHTSELQSHSDLRSFPTRRSSDLAPRSAGAGGDVQPVGHREQRRPARAARGIRPGQRHVCEPAVVVIEMARPRSRCRARRRLRPVAGGRPAEDRKSTRLNSSHTVIYALSLHDALPISLPDPLVLAETFSRLGIGNSGGRRVQLVAYDQDNGMFASRLWWLSRWLGHEAAAVLDGGFARWLAEGRPKIGRAHV